MQSRNVLEPTAAGPPAADKTVLSLAKALSGHLYQVVAVAGGCEIQLRLASLCVLPGQKLRVIQSGSFGPVMISVKGSKLALGRGVSHKVLVRPADRHLERKPPAGGGAHHEQKLH